MNLLYHICISLSIGLILGFWGGITKLNLRKKAYFQDKIETIQKTIKKMASILKYITFLGLGLGFTWCVYFLILGIVIPEKTDDANNMAELIVAVLTVISLLFAFVEFLRRKDNQS